MNIDYIIKLGGSLLYDFSTAKDVLDKIYENKQGNYVVTVGSGYIGEMYKDFIYKNGNIQINFEDSVRDWANLQSINASILSSLNSNYIVCTNTFEVQKSLLKNKIPILDARGFLEVYKNDKYQKSDVRAANMCEYFNCSNLIVITNVDGIYNSDPNKNLDSYIIPVISSQELKLMGRTSVDEGLADKIELYNLNCYVLGVNNIIKNNGKIDENLLTSGTIVKEKKKVYEKKL